MIHGIVYEPAGGAHRNHPAAIGRLSLALDAELRALSSLTPNELRAERRAFFANLGAAKPSSA